MHVMSCVSCFAWCLVVSLLSLVSLVSLLSIIKGVRSIAFREYLFHLYQVNFIFSKFINLYYGRVFIIIIMKI